MARWDDSRQSRRGRWRWAKLLGIAAAALIALLCTFALGYRAYYFHTAGERLQAITAELDAEDPGWRWNDILKARQTVLPSGQNGATYVLAAARLIPRGWPTTSRSLYETLSPAEPDQPLPPDALAQLRAELKSLAPALQHAQRLANTSRGYYEVAWQPDFANTQMPHLQDMRRVADLLRWQALLKIEDGDSEGALTSIRCMLHAGASAGDEPLLLTFIARTACDLTAIEVLERALARGQDKAKNLTMLQHELNDEAEEPVFARGLRGERAAFAEFLDACARGDVILQYTIDGGGQDAPWYGRAYDWLVVRPRARQNEAAFLELTTAAIHKFKQAHPRWPEVYAWFNDAMTSMRSRELYGTVLATALAHQILPAAEADQLRAARLGCAQIALALERYRLKNSTWPGSLDELRPAFLDSIPEDPYVGGPLHYRRLNDGVLVYSFGRDRVDNHGTLNRSQPLAPGTDVGFRLWDASARQTVVQKQAQAGI